MPKKILIMGLPGAGKTYLAERLAPLINATWLNADKVRKDAEDWDFSPEGRQRQANRMKNLAQKSIDLGKHVIADFVCPTPKTRDDFNADTVIWMDTIKEGRFADTNKLFVPPEKVEFRIKEKSGEIWAFKIANTIEKYIWDNKKPTAQMLGRWQPWHAGHQKLFEEIIKKTGQVNIMVRDVQGIGDNPFNFETVKKNIEIALKDYGGRIKISLVPNLTNICYGRGVGYKIEEIVLDEKTQKISATEIRKKLRLDGKL